MSTAILKLHTRALQGRVANVGAIRVPWKIIYASFMVAALALLVFYILQVNTLIKGAYVIKSYQKQISSLTNDNATLQASFAEHNFLGSITERAQELGFEKTSSVTYVQVLQTSLAEAR